MIGFLLRLQNGWEVTDELTLAAQTSVIAEGKAKLRISTDQGMVFYNPRMSFNRDIAILFARSHFPVWRHVRVCDPMTASGVRAVRYALECANVSNVTAADSNDGSVGSAAMTMDLNNVTDRVSVVQADANMLLMSHVMGRFDLVDLDPYGSPGPFFESALRATIDDGVIAASATDMAPLTGARSAACIRKYGITPVRSEFEKEVAIRILASNIVTVAARLELGATIAFSHASDHYARIYAVVRKGRKLANESLKLLEFVEYCPTCLKRNHTPSLEQIRTICEDCGARLKIGGPLWLGSLWDPVTVSRMVENCSTLESTRLADVHNMLSLIVGEMDAPPFYYRTDALSRSLRTRPPKLIDLLSLLHGKGYCAVRTHFHANGFRTDASNQDIISAFRYLVDVT